MAGYDFVGGSLKKVDSADFGKAQVYMSDAEYASRGASVKITGPQASTIASGGYTPTVLTRKDGTASVSSVFDPNPAVGAGLVGRNPFGMPNTDGFVKMADGTRVATDRWGTPLTDKGSNYFTYGQGDTTATMKSSSQINDIYSAGQKPPVVPDTPAMQPSQPVSESVAQAIPTIAQPTKTDPVVQSAGTVEKKSIQDTYGRADTIVSDDTPIYKVRAGYRRKSKLGA